MMRWISLSLILVLHAYPCTSQDSAHARHVLREWTNNGFPFAQVLDPCVHRDSLVLVPGEGWVWGTVELNQDAQMDPDLFARMSLLEKGAPVRLEDLEKSRRHLLRTSWFAEVSPAKLYRSPTRNQMIPFFRIRENRSGLVEGWMSLQEGEGFLGRVFAQFDNISGKGRSLQIQAESSKESRKAAFHYAEPYPLGWPFSVGVDGSIWNLDSTQSSAELFLGIGWQQNFEWSYTIASGVREVQSSDQRMTTYWGNLLIMRDGRDRLPLPRQGWMWDLDVGAGSPDSEEDPAKAKMQSSLAIWLPLVNRLGAGITLESGTLWPRHANWLMPELYPLAGEVLHSYWPGSLLSQSFVATSLELHWMLQEARFFAFATGVRAEDVLGSWNWLGEYGFGWEQHGEGVGIDLRLAWSKKSSFGQGLIGVAIRTRF